MDPKMIDLHDDYQHGIIDRREFIRKLSLLAGSAAAANLLLPLLEYNPAQAQMMVAKDDPRLLTEKVEFPGASGPVRASLARPKGSTRLSGVLVIHENRGLNPHIEDVARRLALEGFLALAPDALSPSGGTPADSDRAREMIGKLDSGETLKNYLAAVKYLKSHPSATGKVGVVGFCWGGSMANQLAVHSGDAAAVVPYYGRQPAADDVPRIKAPLLLHYAGQDPRVNQGIAAFEAALKAAGVTYRLYMYEGAQHAFNNDTNAARYNEAAARLAWRRTIDFFNEKLKP